MLDGMTTPDAAERQHSLRTAVARYDDLRLRDSVGEADPLTYVGGSAACPRSPGAAKSTPPPATAVSRRGAEAEPLSRDEALELLALGEVIARKAGYGRQLTVRTARAAGASWSQIGAALGTTKQAAWETHLRWIADQEAAAP